MNQLMDWFGLLEAKCRNTHEVRGHEPTDEWFGLLKAKCRTLTRYGAMNQLMSGLVY